MSYHLCTSSRRNSLLVSYFSTVFGSSFERSKASDHAADDQVEGLLLEAVACRPGRRWHRAWRRKASSWPSSRRRSSKRSRGDAASSCSRLHSPPLLGSKAPKVGPEVAGRGQGRQGAGLEVAARASGPAATASGSTRTLVGMPVRGWIGAGDAGVQGAHRRLERVAGARPPADTCGRRCPRHN